MLCCRRLLATEQFRVLVFQLPESDLDDSMHPEYLSMRALGSLLDLYCLKLQACVESAEIEGVILDLAADIDAMLTALGERPCLQSFCESLLMGKPQSGDSEDFLASFRSRLTHLRNWIISKQ